MAKKLKALANRAGERQLASTVRDSAQQIWLAGLGAFSKTQEEGAKVFEALVKEGAAIESATQKGANATLREAAAKAAGTRDMLEQCLEDSVARSLKRFGVPTRKDVRTLSTRMVALNALIDKIRAEVSPKAAAPRRKRQSR